MFKRFSLATAAAPALTALLLAFQASGQPDQIVYSDSLQNGWANWSWANSSLSNTDPVHTGSNSISVTANRWEALYLHHKPFSSAAFETVSFWINGGDTGGQLLLLQAISNGSPLDTGVQLDPLPKSAWVRIQAPLSRLTASDQSEIDGIWLQNSSENGRGTFFVDDIELVGSSNAAGVTNPVAVVTVNARADAHSIHPEIYGVAFASQAQLEELNVPLNRSGGNSATRYNWRSNAHNAGADWYFESLGWKPGMPPGAEADDFISLSKAAGAEPMITIPMIGWVAKLGPNGRKLAGFSVRKYGPQMAHDPYLQDAGNGIASPSAQPIITNDPADANIPADVEYQSNWVAHLTHKWGPAAGGGLRYYLLDNEPSLWHHTHRDAHPVGETLQEERDKSVRYAGMIKSIDPGAQVVGPEEWGWPGYFESGYDQQWSAAHGLNQFPDRETNGGAAYLPWYLDQMRRAGAAEGRRLLDVFSVHYYPQHGEFSADVSDSMQRLRNRSTRSLWDTNYVDQSWVRAKVMLIPRLKQWVAQYYPGTRIGITEYSWGAENHINGAIAQADVLGIFGREDVDLATRWAVPGTGTPVFNAIKMYRNYDGKKSTFGDRSVAAASPNPDDLSAFAALRSRDGALTIMVINKSLNGVTPLALQIAGFSGAGLAQEWNLTSRNFIARLPDVSCISGGIRTALPPQSITLFVLPP